MCNNVTALREKLNEITAASTISNTGWYQEESNGSFGSSGRSDAERIQLLSPNRICLGNICISPNGDRYGYVNEVQNPLTIEKVRGILVTMFSVATSDMSRETAGLFSKVVDHLATQCFQVSSVKVNLGKGDAEVEIEFTNGFLSVKMVIGDCTNTYPSIDLELEGDYIVSPDFLDALEGDINRGHGHIGVSMRNEKGRYRNICSLTCYKLSERDARETHTVTQEQLNAVLDVAGEVDDVTRAKGVITNVLKKLAIVEPVVVSDVTMNTYQNDSRRYVRIEVRGTTRNWTINLQMR